MFVTRAHHEAVVQFLLERDTWWAGQYAKQLEYNRALVQQIVEMRREGFDKAPATAVLPPRKADPVQDAIALAAKNDAALRRHLGAYARAARAEGTTDDEIVAKVLHWEEDAEGD